MVCEASLLPGSEVAEAFQLAATSELLPGVLAANVWIRREVDHWAMLDVPRSSSFQGRRGDDPDFLQPSEPAVFGAELVKPPRTLLQKLGEEVLWQKRSQSIALLATWN